MKLFQPFLIIALIILSISCSKDETDDSNNNPAPTLFDLPQSSETYVYAKIDGEDFLVLHSDLLSETIGALNVQGTDSLIINTLAIAATNITLTESKTIGITLSVNTPLEAIPLNTPMTFLVETNGEVTVVASIGVYNISVSGGDDLVDATSQDLMTNTVSVTITELDLTNNIVSGNFSFMAKDEDTGITYDISNGVFNKIAF